MQDPIFSLSQTNKYSERRDTRARGVTPDIPYFVTESFGQRYARDPRSLRMVEQSVEQEFEYKLRNECYVQKEQQHRLMYQVGRAARLSLRDLRARALARTHARASPPLGPRAGARETYESGERAGPRASTSLRTLVVQETDDDIRWLIRGNSAEQPHPGSGRRLCG